MDGAVATAIVVAAIRLIMLEGAGFLVGSRLLISFQGGVLTGKTYQTRWPQFGRSRLEAIAIAMTVTIVFGVFAGCRRETARDTDLDSTPVTAAAGLPAVDPTEADNAFQRRLQDEFSRVNPQRDGWQSESFHDAAKHQLEDLGHWLIASSRAEPDSNRQPSANTDKPVWMSWLDESAQATALLPVELSVAHHSSGLEVLKPGRVDTTYICSTGMEVVSELQRLVKALGESETAHVHFKIYRVTLRDTFVETFVYYHADGQADERREGGDISSGPTSTAGQAGGRSVQQNAEWRLKWTLPGAKGELPRIVAIELTAYEEVRARWPGRQLFVEQTEQVLGTQAAYQDHLRMGLEQWSRRLQNTLGIEPTGYNGLAMGDANGDGLDDLYVCQTGGLPNRLLMRQQDGTLRDAASHAGVDWLENSRSALFVDLDNDGDQDLAVVVGSELLLMSNEAVDGKPSFRLRARIRTEGSPFSLAAADPDADGDLDLYICCYGNVWGGLGDFDHHVPAPMHDANNGSRNVLLRNDGLTEQGSDVWLRFTNVTADCGLDQNNTRWSLSAAWDDFDNDGDQDLYVANDFGRNNLYRNDTEPGGPLAFVDVAAESGVEDLSPGMSADWGDANNDGFMDLYVSNMFSGAGNRITFQPQFLTEVDDETRAGFQRSSRGNSLFINPLAPSERNRVESDQNADRFLDVGPETGVSVGRWAWASRFADLNNDGWQDLLVANGFMTQADPDDL